MKNEQEYLGKPEGKKPGPVMRCDKAYQEIRQILKPGLLSFFFFLKNPGHYCYKFRYWLGYHYIKHYSEDS